MWESTRHSSTTPSALTDLLAEEDEHESDFQLLAPDKYS